jgi:hypothetical protein
MCDIAVFLPLARLRFCLRLGVGGDDADTVADAVGVVRVDRGMSTRQLS